MNADNTFKISREQLYNEIWTISVAGVAKKYGVPYSRMVKCCKDADIPTPAPGYWQNKNSGNPVIQIPMPESKVDIVIIPIDKIPKNDNTTDIKSNKTEILKQAEKPVNDSVSKDTLPSVSSSSQLKFFNKNYTFHNTVFKIKISDENTQQHNKIIAYKNVVNEWNKKNCKLIGTPPQSNKYMSYDKKKKPPFLAGDISIDNLPRVYQLLDILYKNLETFGCLINDDLSISVQNETVHLNIQETQSPVAHILTAQEEKELHDYKENKNKNYWIKEPKFGKYDFIFNGRIILDIENKRTFKDSKSEIIEDQIGDILIGILEVGENMRIEREQREEKLRKEREAREEELRKRREEERLREEKRIKYATEVEKTNTLEDEAQDWYTAYKIRAYINAFEASADIIDNEMSAWIDWANKKADWYDPIISRTDELLGKRKRKKS